MFVTTAIYIMIYFRNTW